MSIRKQIPNLCKLYCFQEEIPEVFLDKADVDSYFYHNVFDTSQCQHRMIRVSKGANKNFRNQVVPILRFKDTAALYPPRTNDYLQKQTQFCGRQFAQYQNDIFEHPSRQIRLSFCYGNKNFCVFSIKQLELHGNQYCSYRNCQPSPSRSYPSLQQPIVCWLQTSVK